jgi:hypothetical protein
VRLFAGWRAAGAPARRAARSGPWGRVDADPLPYGVTRFRLVVYPPDVTAGARLLVRAWRSWPMAGAVASAAAGAAAVPLVGLGPAAAACLLGYLGGLVVLGVASLPERRLVRQVWVEDPGECVALDEVLGPARVRLLAELLCAADEALAAGELSSVDHLGIWRFVYDEVGALLLVEDRPDGLRAQA